MSDRDTVSTDEKISSLLRVGKENPRSATLIIAATILASVSEAVGLTFVVPIINIARESDPANADVSGIQAIFVDIFRTLHVPFTIEYVLALASLVLVLRFALQFFVQWQRKQFSLSHVASLQKRAFTQALEADPSYYDETDHERIANAIVTQARYTERLLDQTLNFASQASTVFMYVAVAFYISPMLTSLAAVLVAIITLLVRKVLIPAYHIGDEVAEVNEAVHGTVQTAISGIIDVKLFNLSEAYRTDLYEQLDGYVDSSVRLVRNKSWINNAQQAMIVIVVFLLIYLALEFADLSFGSLAVFMFAMFRLAPRASSLSNSLYTIRGNLSHLVRTHELIDELEANTRIARGSEPAPDSFERLSAENVTFGYEEDSTVLDDVSFDVESGEFVAFVGPSGAGKSTIISLVARLYEPDGGRITVNGRDLSEIRLDEWRDEIAVIRQNPYVFHETLRDNIAIGDPNATDEEIERVAAIARVDEFVDELQDGYETVLGEDGVKLSGGQRQRVAIARALLKDAPILLFDEATSDLDNKLEEEIHATIENLDRDYTLVVVAHRLSTVTNADCIYTMEDGQITESGSHEELLDAGGSYAELYAG